MTGASCEDAWKKVGAMWPGESREKTEQQVKEAKEVEAGSRSKEHLSSGGSVGGEGWVEEKHLHISRKEADVCKGMDSRRGQKALCLKGSCKDHTRGRSFSFL